jgi:hypothetical protein
MRPTISNANKLTANGMAPRGGRKTQFDDGGNIAVSEFDRNDFADAICNPRRLDDGRLRQQLTPTY